MGAYGRLQIDSSGIATYMASSAMTTPAAATTDIFTVTGSGTKTVKILRIMCAYAAAGVSPFVSPVFLIKRSTAGSGGTATTETDVPLDSAFAAGTATVKTFTANPTVGTIIARIVTGEIATRVIDAAQTAPSPTIHTEIFDSRINGAPIVLRGTSEQVAVNFNGTIPGGTSPLLGFTVVWTEE